MKHVLLAVAAAGLALGGCATQDQDRIDPHRNYPDLKTGNVEQTGTLSVRDLPETTVNAPENQLGEHGRVPKYVVYDSDGNFVAESRSGTADLLPGRYLVRLNESAENEANRTFWVTVESGKTTIIDAHRIPESNKANAD